MSTKVDQTSVVEPMRTKMSTGSSPGGAKVVSKFAAKAGFVIPKNKLSGSLVPVFKGSKHSGGNDAVKEESTNQVQRKTKWGPDLTQDSAIRKARALAYQTRVDQISEQLKSGRLEPDEIQASTATSERVDSEPSSREFEYKKLELELEKQEAIYEILKLDSSYTAPADYKPLLKEAKVPIPIKEYPGFNFISLVLGSKGENLNRLEKETGAKIQLFGTKSNSGEKVEISPSDGSEDQVAYEELTVHLSAESYEKVDAAISVIELLVTSILNNYNAGDEANSSNKENSSTSVVPAANQQLMPLVGATPTPGQGQFQHQNTWFQSVSQEAQIFPPNFNQNYLAPNDPLHTQSSSLNPSTRPSAFGPRPDSASGFNLFKPDTTYFPRNFPASQLYPAQPNITGSRPFPGSQAQPAGLIPMSRPVGSSLPQPVPTVVQGSQSAGWSGAPFGGSTSLDPVNLGRNSAIVSPHGFPSSTAPSIMSAPNAVSFASFGSRPVRPQSSNVLGNPAGGPISASFPHVQGGPFSTSRPISSSSQVLDIPSSPNLPMHPVLGSAPQANPHSGVGANFASTRPNILTGPKPMHSGPGNFAFHPQHSQNPASHSLPGMNNLHGAPTPPLPSSMVPQSSSFRMAMPNSTPQLGMHAFPRAHQRGQSQTHLSAPPFGGNPVGISVPPRSLLPNPSLVPTSTPGMQMGLRKFDTVPQLPNMAGPFHSRPGNSFQPQQTFPTAPRGNFLPSNQNFGRVPSFASGGTASHRGGQIYDPFSPTSISARPQQQTNLPANVRKQENDPEYEDLMASVGVK